MMRVQWGRKHKVCRLRVPTLNPAPVPMPGPKPEPKPKPEPYGGRVVAHMQRWAWIAT